jgi:hypothetical protein
MRDGSQDEARDRHMQNAAPRPGQGNGRAGGQTGAPQKRGPGRPPKQQPAPHAWAGPSDEEDASLVRNLMAPPAGMLNRQCMVQGCA